MGRRGENQAITFLQQKGFLILETNIRYRNSEIDIVALDQQLDEVVFVEVKTRSKPYFGDPSEAVTQRKMNSLNLVAQTFLSRRQLENDFRFDIISILPGSIEHLTNVAWSR